MDPQDDSQKSSAQRLAESFIKRSPVFIAFIALLTVFFAVGWTKVAVRTVFSDFVPTNDPITDTFRKHIDFGNPLLVQILIRAKHGTIFTPAGLAKVYRLTQAVDLIPGVDHEHVISIASPKIRMNRAIPTGVISLAVMEDFAPTTQAEADEVRLRARNALAVYGILVSPDESAALVEVGFHENTVDYDVAFKKINQLIAKENDADHEVLAAGRVMLTGWVYLNGRRAFWIFIASLAIIAIMHVDYMRSFTGAATPLIAAATATIWGVGLAGWMGLNVDPMTLVIPVLLTARALSHSVQMVRRYYETLYEIPDKVIAAASSLRTMFAPALLAILCDAIGLYMVYLAPVPLLKNLAIVHGNWSMMLILNIELLTPALLAVLPVPRDLSVFITREHPTMSTRIIRPAQVFFEKLVKPEMKYRTLFVMTVLGVVAFFVSVNRPVGNVAVGSPLLFPNNPFNVAEREINRALAGTTFMNVVWEGKVNQALRTAAVNASMRRFQEAIDFNRAAAANVSLADLESPANALINGGNPKWLPIDHTNQAVSGTINVMTSGKSVRNLSRVADYTLTDGDVILWFKDLRHSTVDKAMAEVRKALGADFDSEHKEYRVKLAAGPVALQYSIDNAVRTADIKILVSLLAVIGLISWITYGSITAALMLLIPLVLSQFITGMVMYLKGIGLDLNTLPVNAIGLGVGIDYGIYLLSRICDEYQRASDGDIVAASVRAIDTTGEGTLFVAATITLGVLPWYFIAKLKFLSDLGFMLALTMTFNAVMAMIVVPLQVVLVKPKFLSRVQLMKHA